MNKLELIDDKIRIRILFKYSPSYISFLYVFFLIRSIFKYLIIFLLGNHPLGKFLKHHFITAEYVIDMMYNNVKRRIYSVETFFFERVHKNPQINSILFDTKIWIHLQKFFSFSIFIPFLFFYLLKNDDRKIYASTPSIHTYIYYIFLCNWRVSYYFFSFLQW